jgi:hypothetical protein
MLKMPQIMHPQASVYETLPRGQWWLQLRPIAVTFGDPTCPEELARQGEGDQPHGRLAAALHDHVATLGKAGAAKNLHERPEQDRDRGDRRITRRLKPRQHEAELRLSAWPLIRGSIMPDPGPYDGGVLTPAKLAGEPLCFMGNIAFLRHLEGAGCFRLLQQ